MKNRRLIPRLIFGPIQWERAYQLACLQYAWFRRGNNRFAANGFHGHSGYLFFAAYDNGLRELPRDEFEKAYCRDAAQHTRARFAKHSLKSRGRDQ